MLNKFKNVVSKLNIKFAIQAAQFMSVGFVIFAIPFTNPQPTKSQETRIKFDQTSVIPLTLQERNVEIYSAGSREDLNNRDPEAIKGIMKVYGEKYGVDWRMVFAIGYHESGNYNSSLARNQNNFFGRKASGGGYASWSTPEEGIENEFVYLKTRYLDKGMTTPATINPVYAEDMSWHVAVESVMATL